MVSGTIQRALASTLAAIPLKTRLLLHRGLDCKCASLEAQLQRQRFPLDTSSQFTPRHPGQSGPRTQERRFRPRLPR
eukprot:845500-Pyramimonas_sp.AAC.1